MKEPIPIDSIDSKPRYLSLKQAGEYFGGRSAEAMRWLCRRGVIPCAKVAGRIVIDRRDVDRVMADSRIAA